MDYDLESKEDLLKIVQNLKEILVMLSINRLRDELPLPLSYDLKNTGGVIGEPTSQFCKLKAVAYNQERIIIQN